MTDEYISREKTLELLKSLSSRDYRRKKGTIQDAIKMISYACSECGNAESNDSYYCRLCGAKMDGV